jgi:hypothetical protein
MEFITFHFTLSKYDGQEFTTAEASEVHGRFNEFLSRVCSSGQITPQGLHYFAQPEGK